MKPWQIFVVLLFIVAAGLYGAAIGLHVANPNDMIATADCHHLYDSLNARIAELDSATCALSAQVQLLDSINAELNSVGFGVNRCIEYARFAETLEQLRTRFPPMQ